MNASADVVTIPYHVTATIPHHAITLPYHTYPFVLFRPNWSDIYKVKHADLRSKPVSASGFVPVSHGHVSGLSSF